MEKVMYDFFYKLEDKHWWFQARKEILLRLIDKYCKPSSQAKVLDIGCGTGMVLKYLAKYGEVWGIDNSPKAVEYAKIRAPNAKIILGELPKKMPAERFDLITALDFLEHIEDDERFLESISDLLNDKGLLVITVPAFQFLWTGHDEMNLHKRRYTKRVLKEKIERIGLKIEKISYYNTILFVPIVLAKISKKLSPWHKKNSHFGKNPPSLFINNILKIIFSFEKYFLPFINFPFGISIIAIVQKK